MFHHDLFKFLIAGWYVVTKGNSLSTVFGFCFPLRADCLESKVTSDCDLSIYFFGASFGAFYDYFPKHGTSSRIVTFQ